MPSLFLIDRVFGSVCDAQMFSPLWRFHCHIWWMPDKQYFSQKLIRVSRSLIQKTLTRPFFIFKGIMNSQCYEGKLQVNYLLKATPPPRDEPNGPQCPLGCFSWYYWLESSRKYCEGFTQWALMTLLMTILRLFRWRQYKYFLGINIMVLIAPWDNSLDIISLQPVKKLLGINPMGLIFPWYDFLEIISLHTEKTIIGINTMVLSDFSVDSLDVIALQTVR